MDTDCGFNYLVILIYSVIPVSIQPCVCTHTYIHTHTHTHTHRVSSSDTIDKVYKRASLRNWSV